MDDLMAQLQNILSTPQGQEQLKSVASMLGMNNNSGDNNTQQNQNTDNQQNMNFNNNQQQTQQQNGGFDLSALASMFSQAANQSGQTDSASSAMPNIDMGTLLKVQQAFAGMNSNDSNSQLLMALKPHFGEKRQQKVDQAINIMRMIKMLPMLKESGLFG